MGHEGSNPCSAPKRIGRLIGYLTTILQGWIFAPIKRARLASTPSAAPQRNRELGRGAKLSSVKFTDDVQKKRAPDDSGLAGSTAAPLPARGAWPGAEWQQSLKRDVWTG